MPERFKKHSNPFTTLNSIMKSIRPLLGIALAFLAATALADSKVTTVIDGRQIPKDLTKLTFSDKTVTLTFSDNSTEIADMSLVSITIDHSSQSAITEVIADPKKATGVYNLKGQYLGESPKNLQSGFYIVNGEKIYVK